MAEAIIDRWWSWIVPLTWQLALWATLIAALAWLARRSSPQVRYLLWTLVLVKVLLPPSLAVNWGLGTWGLQPVWSSLQDAGVDFSAETAAAPLGEPEVMEDLPAGESHNTVEPREVLFALWLAGLVAMLGTTAWSYWQLRRMGRALPSADEGPVRIALERTALRAGISRLPDVLVATDVASPYLFGIWRPRIVLPRALVEKFTPTKLEGVLLHELTHLRRGDLWVGAVQALVQSLLWFHPFVWWANARLRQERECACDEQALRESTITPADYGQTLLNVLSLAKGRVPRQANLVGVFEPGANVQQRLEEIMKDQPRVPISAMWYLALGCLLLVFLPMASVSSATDEAAADAASKATATESPSMPAWIVSTEPAIGATDVDPDLKEISVTFDRNMGGGMSWTGGGEEYPPSPDGARAEWRDKRTCVLPVKLKKVSYYRVGLNSKSFLNFRSADGVPLPPSAIYFTTEGASRSLQARVRVPKIVKMVPENGATDIDPNLKAIRVTFDMPMGGGMSWTGGGNTFPASPDGPRAKWSPDGKTCVLPVSLAPGKKYQLGINSPSHNNFQSKWGVPAVPVMYEFMTRE